MKCPECGAEVSVENKFCPSCGKQLPKPAAFCRSCGNKMDEGQAFCTSCGARRDYAGAAAAPPPPPPGEAGAPSGQQERPFQPGKGAGPDAGRNVPRSGAGVGLRAVATLVDWAVLMFLGYMLAAVSGTTTSGGFELKGASFFLMSAVGFAYYLFFEGTRGATPGKMLLGLKVIKTDGSNCDLAAAAVRTVLRLVDGLPLFYLLGAVLVWTSPRKQRLGDRVAGTLVVRGGRAEFARAGGSGAFADYGE